MRNLFNKLLIPFAIIHIRWIQWRYKYITVNYPNRQTESNLHALRLLQAIEYYYKRQFSAWGKFHPSFSFTHKAMQRHIKFLNWLFPEKYFKEWDLVIWHNPEAVTYYHNKIYDLQKGVSTHYEIEIPRQIKKWKEESEKHYRDSQ